MNATTKLFPTVDQTFLNPKLLSDNIKNQSINYF